jgi:hypothetical protein
MPSMELESDAYKSGIDSSWNSGVAGHSGVEGQLGKSNSGRSGSKGSATVLKLSDLRPSSDAARSCGGVVSRARFLPRPGLPFFLEMP